MLYLVTFFSTALFGLFPFVREEKHSKIIAGILFSFLLLFLVLFAGLRGAKVAPDYFNYIDWLYSVGLSVDTILQEFKDPGFLLTFSLIHWVGLPDFVFFTLIAFLSLQAKLIFSKEIFRGYFAYFLFFLIFARFYIVHDLVQVRVGVAVALASCGVIFFYRRQVAKALLFYCLGLSFHLSVVMFLPFIILIMFGFRYFSRLQLVTLLTASFVLSSLIAGLSSQLMGFSRLAPYLNGEYHTNALSLFSFYFLVRLALISSILTFFYQRLYDIEHFALGMSVVGLAFQMLLSWNDSFSLRTAEIFGFFDMACFVMLMRFLDYRSRLIYGFLLFGIAAVFYISSLKLVDTYASVLS